MNPLDEFVAYQINQARIFNFEKNVKAEEEILNNIKHIIIPWEAIGKQKGISIQTYLSYINVSAIYYLNRNQIVTTLNLCNEFDRICRKYKPAMDKREFYEHIDTWSEALFRRGALTDCQSLIRNCLPDITDNHIKCSLLIRLGQAESESNYPNLIINSLCEALGYAENLNDSNLKARCYIEIAKSLGIKHHWLGLSLLCDAEVIDERELDKNSYNEIMMHKALSFYAIYNRSGYDKKCEIYLEEAKRVISLVKIDDSTQSSTKAFYNMYYGQIYADIDKLKEALSFYEAVGSIDNIIKACDHILVAAVRNNDNKEGLDIIPKYLQYKGMLPDCAKKRSDIQQILELEKILKCNIQNQQT